MWWSYGFVILSLLAKEAVGGGNIGLMQYLWANQWRDAMKWPTEAFSILPNYVEYYPMPIYRDKTKDPKFAAGHGLGWYFILTDNIFIEVQPWILNPERKELMLSFHKPTDEDAEHVREALRDMADDQFPNTSSKILYPSSSREKNMPYNVFVPYKSEPRFLSDREPQENWLRNHYIPVYIWLRDNVKELQWWMLRVIGNSYAIVTWDTPADEYQEVLGVKKRFGITTTVYKQKFEKVYKIEPVPVQVGNKRTMQLKETEVSRFERNIANRQTTGTRLDGYFSVIKSNHGEFLGSERCTYWNPKPLQYKPIPKLPSPSDPVTSKRSSRSPTSRENRQLAASELGTGQ